MRKKAYCILLCIFMVSGLVFSSNVNGLVLNDSITAPKLETVFEHENWWWTTAEVVSTESTGTSKYTSLAVDSVGNVHIAWYDYTDYSGCGTDVDIFYKFWNSSSSLWSVTEVVSTESTGTSVEPSLAIDSEDNLHVTWDDTTDYNGAGTDYDIFYKSRSSGGSWGSTEVVSTESTGHSQKNSLAIDSEDNLHVVWQDTTDYNGAGFDGDIFYKSRSSGGSWGSTEVVSTESTSGSDNCALFVDSTGDVHVSWRDSTDYNGAGTDFDVFYKVLDSSSSFWSVTNVVSTESTDGSMSSSLVVDSVGNVHIAWYDYTDYSGAGGVDTDIFYKFWDDGSSTWSVTEVISTESTSGSYYPAFAIDSADNLHLIWRDYTEYLSSGTDPDVFYKLKDASNGVWSTTELVSSESTNTVEFVSITVDYFDNIHVSWYDLTDYLGCGTDYDIFYKKFVGPPTAPAYLTAAPGYSTDGVISLDWADVARTDAYYLYRETAYIASTTGLTPLLKLTESNYTDTLNSDDTYYYAVVAENEFGNSTLSSVADVQVAIQSPTQPTNETDSLLSFISNEGLILFGVLLGTQLLFFVLSIIIKRKK